METLLAGDQSRAWFQPKTLEGDQIFSGGSKFHEKLVAEPISSDRLSTKMFALFYLLTPHTLSIFNSVRLMKVSSFNTTEYVYSYLVI